MLSSIRNLNEYKEKGHPPKRVPFLLVIDGIQTFLLWKDSLQFITREKLTNARTKKGESQGESVAQRG